MIAFTLPIDPVAKARPRMARSGHVYTPSTTVNFERAVKQLSKPYAPIAPLLGAIKLTITFYMRTPQRRVRELPTVKPDWDNLGKAISDSLNELMWVDDCQITHATVIKRYDWQLKKGSIHVRIEEDHAEEMQRL